MTPARVLAAAAALLVASALPAFAAPSGLPAYRGFGHWIVACDVSGACEARGFTDDGERGVYPVLLRDAGAHAVPVLELRDTPERGSTILLDGRVWRPSDPGALTWVAAERHGEPRRARIRGVVAVREFVTAARRASSVEIGGARGTLEGFNAAVLFVDDVQGRVGTAGALARPGASNRAVPGPRPLPPLPAGARGIRPLPEAEARRYVAGLQAVPGDCDDDARSRPPEAYSLPGDDVLLFLPCWSGAYQSTDAVYAGPRSSPRQSRRLLLPLPPGLGEGDDGTVTGASFDPASGVLSSFSKGRGLGDCGARGRWVFDGRGFRLAEYALLDRCGWYAPGDFPVLWRSAAGATR